MAEQKANETMALEKFTKKEAIFVIADKKFTMKPLVPKKLRILINAIEDSGKELKSFMELNNIIDFVLAKTNVFFPIVFNDDITQEFADENISIPLCLEIWETFVAINRLEGILPFLKQALKLKQKEGVNIKENQD